MLAEFVIKPELVRPRRRYVAGYIVINLLNMLSTYFAQNPLDTFSRSFPVDEEDSNLLPTCYGLDSDTANMSR